MCCSISIRAHKQKQAVRIPQHRHYCNQLHKFEFQKQEQEDIEQHRIWNFCLHKSWKGTLSHIIWSHSLQKVIVIKDRPTHTIWLKDRHRTVQGILKHRSWSDYRRRNLQGSISHKGSFIDMTTSSLDIYRHMIEFCFSHMLYLGTQ